MMADSSERVHPEAAESLEESATDAAAALTPPHPRKLHTYVRVFGVFFFLYLFLVSIKAMGTGLKTYAKDDANQTRIQALFDYATNPFVGLAVGILVTSVVQSSSFTTSFIIMLVATGELSIERAVPAIMGANIGTSITNTLVSLAHWRSRREFRVAFSAAVVHDIFNFLTVAILLPIELMFGLLSKIATWSAHFFSLPEDMDMGKGIVKTITEPVIHWISEILGSDLGMTSNAVGLTLASLGVLMLFVALIMLVKMLRGLMLGRLEYLFRRFFFTNTATALIVGLVVTVMVQSSSVTTSLIIPFVGAGLLTLRQVFPYMIGANIGTTCTGLIAAAAANTGNALVIAFVHLIFNLFGAAIFIPLRDVPINLAKRLSKIVAHRRLLAVSYVVGIFIVLPIVCVYVFSWWNG